jgi:hypothetical protein
MKKVLYKSLYAFLLTLTNRFNSRLLSKFKIFLGVSLLILTSSCNKEKEKDPEIMCYMPAEPPQESMVIESGRTSSISGDEFI